MSLNDVVLNKAVTPKGVIYMPLNVESPNKATTPKGVKYMSLHGLDWTSFEIYFKQMFYS